MEFVHPQYFPSGSLGSFGTTPAQELTPSYGRPIPGVSQLREASRSAARLNVDLG